MTEKLLEITSDTLRVPKLSTKSGDLTITAADDVVFQSGKIIDFTGTDPRGLVISDATFGLVRVYNADDAQIIMNSGTDGIAGNVAKITFNDGLVASPTTVGLIESDNDSNVLRIQSAAGKSLALQTNGANDRLTINSAGAVTVSGSTSIQNITLSNQTIETNNGNLDLILTANGAGSVVTSKDLKLSTNRLVLTNTDFDILRYCGTGTGFALVEKGGPVLHGADGGLLGIKSELAENITYEWSLNDSVVYANTALTFTLQADTSTSGGAAREAHLRFAHGDRGAETLVADVQSIPSLNEFTIDNANGIEFSVRTDGTKRLIIETGGSGQIDYETSFAINYINGGNESGNLLFDNNGAKVLTNQALPMFIAGTTVGANSFGTLNAGHSRIIWALIDGNQADGAPEAISRQSGGITAYGKVGVGEYQLTLQAGQFGNINKQAVVIVTPIDDGNTDRRIAKAGIINDNIIGIKLFNEAGVSVDGIINIMVVGHINP